MKWDAVKEYGEISMGPKFLRVICRCGWIGDGYHHEKGARLALIRHVSVKHKSEPVPERE